MMEALEYGIVGVNTGAVSNEVGRSAASRNPAWGAKAPSGIEEFLELKYVCLAGKSLHAIT